MLVGAALVAGGSSRAADPVEQKVTGAEIAALLQPIDGGRVEHSLRLGATLDRTRELDCLTQAVYFEARGETARGQQAVAQVVLNRVKSPRYPKTVCGVVYQGAAKRAATGRGCQFSFACDGSTRRGRETAAWERARKIATRAMAGQALAEIGGATHFHTTGVSPGWAGMTRVAQVGLHVFYRPGPRGGFAEAREAITEQAVMTSLSAATVAAIAAPVHVAASLASENAVAAAPTPPLAVVPTLAPVPPKADLIADASVKTTETTTF